MFYNYELNTPEYIKIIEDVILSRSLICYTNNIYQVSRLFYKNFDPIYKLDRDEVLTMSYDTLLQISYSNKFLFMDIDDSNKQYYKFTVRSTTYERKKKLEKLKKLSDNNVLY